MSSKRKDKCNQNTYTAGSFNGTELPRTEAMAT